MNLDFYANLKLSESFEAARERQNQTPLPAGWSLIVSDVKGSTKAIESGHYKYVNIIGAASIVTALNALKGVNSDGSTISVPFVFGGDGATLAVPNQFVSSVGAALLGLKRLAESEFGLSLRVAAVAVEEISRRGKEILVARFQASPTIVQAVIAGGGATLAEQLIKHPELGAQFEIKAEGTEQLANCSGLECRWEDVKSRYGETISLIVEATTGDAAQDSAVYGAVSTALASIYGSDDECRPITESKLKLSLRSQQLAGEVAIKAYSLSGLTRATLPLQTKLLNFLGTLLMNLKISTPQTNWGQYRREVSENTDFKRFVDGFRMVLSGTPSQRERLTLFLEESAAAGELNYGIHVSDRALMTCLVYSYSGDHIHFVDAADGGFTMAAKALKERSRLRS